MCNLICPICRESLCEENHTKICTLPCGHVFHDYCIYNWLESAQTCPNCRIMTTTAQILKLYFQILIDDNNHSIDDAVVTNELANTKRSLESCLTHLREKAHDLNTLTKRFHDISRINDSLRHESKVLNGRIEELEGTIKIIKKQRDTFKQEIAKLQKSNQEYVFINNSLRKYERMEKLLEGSFEEANDILNTESLDFTALKVCFMAMKRNYMAAMESEIKLKRDYCSLFSAFKKTSKLNGDFHEKIAVKDRIIESLRKEKRAAPKRPSLNDQSPGPSTSYAEQPAVATEPVPNKRVCVMLTRSSKLAAAKISNEQSQNKNLLTTYNGLGGHSREEKFPNAKLRACKIVSNRKNKI